jgi:hypothetical protein
MPLRSAGTVPPVDQGKEISTTLDEPIVARSLRDRTLLLETRLVRYSEDLKAPR